HESPLNITGVLMALAGACLIIGPLLGFPALWSGHEPLMAQWLEPVTNLSDKYLSGAREFHENHGLEWAFMFVSVGVATLGWFAARFLYRDAAATEAKLAAWKAQYAGVHRLVYEKYRVDELYQATVVRAFTWSASAFSWIDANIVDGVVNLM